MTVAFNHTIIFAKDKVLSAEFFARIFGVARPRPMWSFMTVMLADGVALDFANSSRDITAQHYAFLVSEDDFDGILGRIEAEHLPYWADPAKSVPQQINRNDGGRGVYFHDPAGHLLEAITRPYGSGGTPPGPV
ncbi:VOC family protein [Arthrobacter sp. I2-34]|uniref:VOC family protein n=1 Tax=Arthrobacter hankyongi TaxID=2904801 RepID=A0ABS9L231_9MICC|nr:VOC family protein [Arthrobacter hankyongi]MCG2620716.1 VOC family protein [Arthrobacter hankyongi]